MEEIHITEEPQGTFSCHVGISTQEWQMLLSNCELTTPNYRFALLAFYDAPNHTATCKELSLQYYGESSNAQKFNSWIANYGKAIVKHLNRFQIVDSDGSRRYWHVTMCRGTYTNDGHFETTLRPEIVEAIKNLDGR